MFRIVNDDVISGLHDMPDNSFDGAFCDPPYELGFMGKSWDSTGIAFQPETWAEVLRVCKPGAHLMAFGGSRTFHRLVCAVEDAGWEVRDVLMWVYGSGFPKSLDVSKAIDKAAGAEREVVGHSKNGIAGGTGKHAGVESAYGFAGEYDITSPATESARHWNGYGTALKPAYEPVVLARKPLDGTVAQNVQKWGCGALWIDGVRIGEEIRLNPAAGNKPGGNSLNMSAIGMPQGIPGKEAQGRWPANVLHDGLQEEWARYFYCAKASTRERNAGCEALPERSAGDVTGGRKDSSAGLNSPRAGAGRISGARNIHPTVKPLDLCRYLATLILPPAERQQGTRKLLVPFSGSGSEMIGSLLAGWEEVTGVEREAEYVAIAKARISHYMKNLQARLI